MLNPLSPSAPEPTGSGRIGSNRFGLGRAASLLLDRVYARVLGGMMMLALAALVAQPARAATTWVVDRASASCSPLGPGNDAVPFCTIQAAAQVAFPGDTVLVKPAIYREQVTPPASGLPGAPITYRATGPGAIILGTVDLSDWYGWSYLSAGIWKRPYGYLPRQVFVDGHRLTSASSLGEVIDNSYFYDDASQTLYADIGGGNPGAGHIVEAGAFTYGFNIVDQGNLVVQGFTMRRQNSVGVRTLGASGVIIRNIEVSSAATYGIRSEAGAGPVIIEGCNVWDSASNGILVLNTNGVTVRNSASHDNAFHGISLQGSNQNLVAGNTCYRNVQPVIRSAAGIDISQGSEDNTIVGNTTYENQDSGIQIYDHSDRTLVARNVSWDNGDHGFDTSGASSTRFISNTSYHNFKDGISIERGQDIVVSNNIAVDNGLTNHEFDLYVDELALADFKSDYNIFWNSVPGTVVQFNNVNFDTIDDFRMATGNEERGIGVDPRFIDVSRFDLRVAADSPAIDSADSAADGFQIIDHNGFPPSDDPTVEDAGRGSVAYADRGAFENNPAPTVALQVTPPIGAIDLSVEADASLSRTYEGAVVSRFSFDFGDGTLIGPQLSPIADHTYSFPGNYTVTVYATDRTTASASTIVSALDRPPSVVLTLTPNPKNPQIVTVDASHSSDDDSTPIVSYLFSFGDGTTLGPQASPVAVHRYRSKGFFRIEVTVTDSAGKSSAAAAIVNTRDRFSSLRFAGATAPRLRTRSRTR